MRCLIVKEPYATEIVEGKKSIEYRNQPTNIQERIGIIRAGSKTVIGEVNLIGCDADYGYGKFRWYLRNPRKYRTPKPYKHPRGAQVWVKIS